jgi:PAS domain S-box-containing protein
MDKHPVVIVDASGVIRHWSAGAATAFGYPAAKAVGQTLDLIVPPEFREAHWKGFRRAIETGAAEVDGQTTQCPVRCADGAVAAFSGAVRLLRTPLGGVIGAMTIFESEPEAQAG